MKFLMWLNVIDGADETKGLFGPNKLFYKHIESSFLPQPGVDEVILYPDEDDDDGTQTEGPMWHVKRRYMGHRGLWHVELAKMILNPNEHWQNMVKSRLGVGRIVLERFWYTDRDGISVCSDLIRGGWREYNSATWTKDNN